MATEIDIAQVKTNIHTDAGTDGDPFDDTHIGNLLDSGLTISQTTRNYWQYRMAHTSDYIDITESGSQRALENIYKHAKELADYWAGIVRDEDAEAEEETPTKQAARLHTITRV